MEAPIEDLVFSVDTDDPVDVDACPAAKKILAAGPRATQAVELTLALGDYTDRDDDDEEETIQKLFRALGVSKTADLISAVLEPVTYRKCSTGAEGFDVASHVQALVAPVSVLLGESDLRRLVRKWSEAEHLNPYVALELFARDANRATRFAGAAIERCLDLHSGVHGIAPTIAAANAKVLAAAACHVLASASDGTDLMPVFVALLRDGTYDRFVALALSGEQELPHLADVARNPDEVSDAVGHHGFGNVSELLTAARNVFKSRPNDVPLYLMNEEELVVEYERVLDACDVPMSRTTDVENEIVKRGKSRDIFSVGLAFFYENGRGSSPHFPANANMTPDMAETLLRNMLDSKPLFERKSTEEEAAGVGGGGRVWWFVCQDETCYVRDDGTTIDTTSISVEIKEAKPFFQVGNAELNRLFDVHRPEAAGRFESRYRSRHGMDDGDAIEEEGRLLLSTVSDWATERDIWNSVRERVATSDEGIAKLDLDVDRFYGKAFGGEFVVVRDPADVHVRDGVPTLLDTLRRLGMEAEPYILEAAKRLVDTLQHAGKVSAVFRIGGRFLLVLSVATDTYKILTAKNKVKASVEAVGGWAGATAAGGTFAHFFLPAHIAAGPMIWVAHGVGTLIAGGIGYWIGSSTTSWVYELSLVDEDKAGDAKNGKR